MNMFQNYIDILAKCYTLEIENKSFLPLANLIITLILLKTKEIEDCFNFYHNCVII